MAQVIHREGGLAGFGQALGQGISEQLPKEVERHRLSSGLRNLSQKKGLNPFQQFSELASTPGITPQMLESGSALLRQQAYLDAIKNQYEGPGNPKPENKGYIPTQEELTQPVKGEISTLATPEDTAQSYKGYIPPTEQQERADAYENFQKNPARYGYDFDNALKERKAITSRNQEIQKSHQEQEKIAVKKEEQVKTGLKNEIDKLKLNKIPPKAYQKFEEKILNAMLSKKEGGEGLTQENAIKKYSKELDQANRNYIDLGSLSSWSPLDFNRQTDALQKEFESRGEQQMMMDQLIADYGISPQFAAHKAFPLKGEMPALKKLNVMDNLNDAYYAQLKKEMGKNNSPLSIADELRQKSRDPSGWLRYLNNHRDNLEVWQADHLTKNINLFDLTDMWLRAWE